MKFKKKPIVIEAELEDVSPHVCTCDDGDGDRHVHTLEGPLRVSPGDWIITGIAGEHYPCKPDIFDRTYEIADE